MKPIASIFTIGALALASCDSPEQNRREQAVEQKADALEKEADAVRKKSERQADAIESTQKQGADKLNPATPADRAANAVREGGETKADALEKAADGTRKQDNE